MAARRSANRNRASAPSKTSSATQSEDRVDLTNKEIGCYTRGPDLVTALMDNVADPQLLYQLISASAQAKRCFDKQPIGYLKASLANLPADLRQVAIAYVIEAEHEPDSDGTPVQRCSCEDDRSPRGATPVVNRRSRISDALDKYLRGSPLEFPKALRDPLRSLQALSAASEAIDLLSKADIWVAMAKNPFEADPSQMKHRTKRALWHLELFCTLFHRDCLAKRASWQHSCECSRASVAAIVPDQLVFFFKLGFHETDDFARVWDDVFMMLQNVYAKKVVHIFEEKYIWGLPGLESASMICGPIGDDSSFQCRKQIVSDTMAEFDGLVNYRMSFGVVYYSAICSTRSSQIMSMDYEMNPKEKSWTDLFASTSIPGCVGHDWGSTPEYDFARFQYQLHRIEDKELQRLWDSSMALCSNVNSNAAGEVDRSNFNDDDSEWATDDDEGWPGRLRGDLDYSTSLGWNLEIVLGLSSTHCSERHLMLDEPIFVNRYPLFQGWISPYPERKLRATDPPGPALP